MMACLSRSSSSVNGENDNSTDFPFSRLSQIGEECDWSPKITQRRGRLEGWKTQGICVLLLGAYFPWQGHRVRTPVVRRT